MSCGGVAIAYCEADSKKIFGDSDKWRAVSLISRTFPEVQSGFHAPHNAAASSNASSGHSE